MHRTVVIFLAVTIGNAAFAASSDSITSVQNAFECKQRLADTPAIRSALGNKEKSELREAGLSGNYTLSQPIKVFGYELQKVHISEDSDTGDLSRNRRNFRHSNSSPSRSAVRSIILPPLWKV